MGIGIDRQHGVALDHLTSVFVDSTIPQPSEPLGGAVGACEVPPTIPASFPAGLIKGYSGNNAALSPRSGLAKRSDCTLEHRQTQ